MHTCARPQVEASSTALSRISASGNPFLRAFLSSPSCSHKSTIPSGAETISVTFINRDGSESTVQVPLGMNMLEAAHAYDIELEVRLEPASIKTINTRLSTTGSHHASHFSECYYRVLVKDPWHARHATSSWSRRTSLGSCLSQWRTRKTCWTLPLVCGMQRTVSHVSSLCLKSLWMVQMRTVSFARRSDGNV